MRYINKESSLVAGHEITDNYLNNNCRVADDNGHYHYQNIDYDGSFRTSGAKEEMQSLILMNQGNRCCYCMRDLSELNQHVTLEHIIPQETDTEEFCKYTSLRVRFLASTDVTLCNSFCFMPDVNLPPRPHTVTFENLVASCDGTFPDKASTAQCCNNRRGKKFVYPLYLDENIESEIVYMKNGTMQPKIGCTHEAEYRQSIENVNLNCSNLKDIRRLWYLLANEDFDDLNASLNDKNLRVQLLRRVLYRDVNMILQDNMIYSKFMHDGYWSTFLMYHWFYKKYRYLIGLDN